MRIIKNENCGDERIVRCPDCNSVFAYTSDDIKIGNAGDGYLVCPCCNNNNWIWSFEDIEEGK